jgi:Arc/MetJ-type ribon-helix-helix transcriptional regulator
MAREPSVTITFRAPKSMEVKLDHMAGELGQDRSECIREAVTRLLDADPNSLQRRVSLLEQRMDSMGHGIGQSAPENAARLGPVPNKRVSELESQLTLVTAELAAARSAIRTLETLIQEGGGSALLIQWFVNFRRNHPPK